MAELLITNASKDQGGLYHFDTARNHLQRLSEQPVRGVTRGPDAYYFTGNTGAVYRFETQTGRVEQKARLPLTGCHDLRWHDGSFFLVATYGNQVLRLNERFEVQDRLQIMESDEDLCHANCLAWVDGRMLLSVFTLSGGRREDKNRSAAWFTHGKVLALDWETKRFDVVFEPLCQPHSLVWRNGTLLCCESHAARLTQLNLATRSSRELCRLHGFVRAIAFADGKAFVGISRNRGPQSLLQRLLSPFQTRCAVVQLDPKNWTQEQVFPMPGTDVYELLPYEPFPTVREFRGSDSPVYLNGHSRQTEAAGAVTR